MFIVSTHMHKTRKMTYWSFLLPTYFLLALCESCFYSKTVKTIPLRKFHTEHGNMAALSETDLSTEKRNLHGKPGFGYYMQVGIGTPPQMVNVLCDTGSSNFAVATTSANYVDTYFNISSSPTFENTGVPVSVVYTQGDWEGMMGRDNIVVPFLPNISISANIACINSSSNFFLNESHWQGILGLAYEDIARPDSRTETFFQSLVTQAQIRNIFCLQMCGTIESVNETDAKVDGSMTIGGLDKSLYQGEILWTPIYKKWYYDVIITDVSIGDTSLKFDCKEYNFDKTIVDSGTTNLRFPSKVYYEVVRILKEKTQLDSESGVIPEPFWEGVDLICWPRFRTPWNSFPVLKITLAESENRTFDMNISPEQYLRPVQDLYKPNTEQDCYKFAIAPSETGTVIGAIVLEGFYVIFDKENSRIGFAQTTCPNRDQRASLSHVSSSHPYHIGQECFQCAYIKPENHDSTLMTVAYVMAGICGVCLIPLILMIIQWQWKRCRPNSCNPPYIHSDNSGLLDETS